MDSPDALKQEDLDRLEADVQRATATGDTSQIELIGYGEVTTVLRLDTAEGSFACKRLPRFKDADEAARHEEHVYEYIERLGALGVESIPTVMRSVKQDDGSVFLHCVQPIIDPDTIGPAHMKNASEADALASFIQILKRLENSVTNEIAPDGQLSNWAFVDGALLYLDVSTPFLRHADGSLALDWTPFLGVAPWPLRGYYRSKIPEVVAVYHDLRGQLIDLLANMRKEKIDDLLPSFIACANERLAFDSPITMDEVKKYYNENADTYALLLRIKQADRWFHRNILRKPYPYILPPTIERNKF